MYRKCEKIFIFIRDQTTFGTFITVCALKQFLFTTTIHTTLKNLFVNKKYNQIKTK